MDFQANLTHLSQNAKTVRVMVQGIPPAQACWRPAPDAWSILEVVNHLYDEEREDFREHLDQALHRPTETWSPIDPGGWVQARAYNDRDLAASLDNFLQERRRSLTWLAPLETADWDATFAAPWGAIRAGDIFAAWVAHDLLHIRQLVELKWALTTDQLAPYQADYAGEW